MFNLGSQFSPIDGFPDFYGTIAYIAPNFNSKTRTVLIRVILDNKKGLFKPGLYATGVISVSSKDPQVVIPRSAVQMIAGEKVVFVPAGKGFAATPVTVGRNANDFIEILYGLKSGQKYVSQGSFELKAVMITGGMDPHAGHGAVGHPPRSGQPDRPAQTAGAELRRPR